MDARYVHNYVSTDRHTANSKPRQTNRVKKKYCNFSNHMCQEHFQTSNPIFLIQLFSSLHFSVFTADLPVFNGNQPR